jgi:hypothetical protein
MAVVHPDVILLMILTVRHLPLAVMAFLKTTKPATAIVLLMILALMPGQLLTQARMFAWFLWSWVLPSSVRQIVHTIPLPSAAREMVAAPMAAWA